MEAFISRAEIAVVWCIGVKEKAYLPALHLFRGGAARSCGLERDGKRGQSLSFVCVRAVLSATFLMIRARADDVSSSCSLVISRREKSSEADCWLHVLLIVKRESTV